MKKMLFVMNPYSGMRRANKYLADIISLFNQAGYETLVHMTQGQGDATRIVAKRAAQCDLIVCCGGDGTFNETVSGILQAGVDVPVGYIPAGSTNDFAASLKLSGVVMQAAQDILDGEPAVYDIGKFGDRYFSYVASFGAFTRASYTTPRASRMPWDTQPICWKASVNCPRSKMNMSAWKSTARWWRMTSSLAPSAILPLWVVF